MKNEAPFSVDKELRSFSIHARNPKRDARWQEKTTDLDHQRIAIK